MCELIVLRAHFANTQFEPPCRPIRRYSSSQTSSRRIRPPWTKLPHLYWRALRRTRRFEGLILQIRNAKRLQPHPPLLVVTHIEQTYTVTVDQATAAILEGPAAYSPV